MSVEIKYKGNTIAAADTDTTKTLQTAGKYCEADIIVEHTPNGSGGGGAYDITSTDNGDGTQSLAIVDASGAIVPFNAIVEDITITANCVLGDAVRTEVEAFVLANGRTIADVACAVFQYKGAGREQNRVMSCLFFNYNGDGTWDTPVEMARYRDGAVQYQPMSSSYAGIMNAGDVYQMVLALNPTV